MNRMDRLTAILLLLQEKARTANEIAGHFEVSRRTIIRDILALYEIGVPIISREGAGGGYSLPSGYKLAPLPLTNDEAYLLLLALNSISKLRNAPFGSGRSALSAKMRSLLTPQQLHDVDTLLEVSGVEVPIRSHDTPFLEALVEAAHLKRWLVVTYKSANRLSSQHLLPLEVTSRNGFWYCRAYAHESREERTYRVDRVQSADQPDAAFVPAAPTAPKAYNDPTHPQVEALLTARGISYVQSDADIGGLIDVQPDGSGRLTFRCPPSELAYYARFFAGAASDIEVLAPAELRQALSKIGQELVRRYS